MKNQDEFAAASQNKTEAAQAAGKFKDEIIPVEIPQRRGDPVVFDTDEFPRAGCNGRSAWQNASGLLIAKVLSLLRMLQV